VLVRTGAVPRGGGYLQAGWDGEGATWTRTQIMMGAMVMVTFEVGDAFIYRGRGSGDGGRGGSYMRSGEELSSNCTALTRE
jgi:hypothetical protein